MRRLPVLASLGCLLVTLCVGSAQDDVLPEKAYRNVSPEKIESILAGLKINYKKSSGKDKGIHFYDFERNKYRLRLHNYDGKDLWLDALFTDKTSLEDLNAWNRKAKFSRAVLLKNKDKETISLEVQLDCDGGVTDNIIRNFITRFDVEITQFVKHLSK